jgi:hypothetical protein
LPASAAFAQLPQTAPTREEIERAVPERTAPAPARLSVEGDIERAPCALDRPEYADIRLTLTDAVFDDLKGLPAEALRPAFAGEIGRDNPIAVVCAIRDRAADHPARGRLISPRSRCPSSGSPAESSISGW